MTSSSGLTFAVIGHNEANRLHVALSQALDAAGPGDHVWFVNSASTDDSAARAAALGAEVIDAPIGKGRALAAALEHCRTEYICFIDGDLESSDANIPAVLRAGIETTGADMVVGAYTEQARRRLLGPALYIPLMRTFFPDAFPTLERPFSGQRALRVGFPRGPLPPGYGVEAHLNVHVTLSGGTVVDWPIGRFDSPLRSYPRVVPMGEDVGIALLDLAEAWGRLTSEERREWDAWLHRLLAVIRAAAPGDRDAEIVERIDAVGMPVRDPMSR